MVNWWFFKPQNIINSENAKFRLIKKKKQKKNPNIFRKVRNTSLACTEKQLCSLLTSFDNSITVITSCEHFWSQSEQGLDKGSFPHHYCCQHCQSLASQLQSYGFRGAEVFQLLETWQGKKGHVPWSWAEEVLPCSVTPSPAPTLVMHLVCSEKPPLL